MSFPLMVKGKAWLGIKNPPVWEEQVGTKTIVSLKVLLGSGLFPHFLNFLQWKLGGC